MNNKLDFKKIGLIIIAVASIIMSLSSLSAVIQFVGMYGEGMYFMTLLAIDIVSVSVAYYFSTKNIKGPIIGLIYVAWGMINVGVGIINLSLCVGYILILIHYVTEKKLQQEVALINSEIE